ncbi:MAG: class II aldolase/adducin family protein, partial [Bacillota bacterium]
LAQSQGQAVIMKNHGALCFGKDYDEAFLIARQLEDACREFIVDSYLKLSGRESFDPVEMINFALFGETGNRLKGNELYDKPYCSSRRTDHGFILYDEKGRETGITSNNARLSEEAILHDTIYKNHKGINHIVLVSTPETLAISCSDIKFKALLDDFAQIVGPHAPTVDSDPGRVAAALKKSPVVFIRGRGALCSGVDHDEATAAGMVTQKACQAYIGACLFGRVRPINPLECRLMHFVYQKRYSRKK